jgi:signal transduction histidine kinase
MARLDIPDLMERAMLEAQPLFLHKRQAFHLDVRGQVPPILGDSRWLSRALYNLLSNASKYTPVAGRIILRGWYAAEKNEVILEVEDNGLGIAPANRKKVFEMFYREPRIKDAIPGTGLGLAIVKTVAEQHGGRFYLHSEENQGSIFGLVLPPAIEIEPE